ncbi:CYFA0S03e04962g1_1 [Cyberlindnera fabianii]|uniref:CYFA0S03e04962g1_1 n=1 Tax=Cyberlindnera fabianii TaxID=36022 RepID=A0A061AXX9_CYBFA|nr:hypothetical protein BON22_5091 [Cyberlindnera fabianii]CDR39580.1 CYFA0S03e04962g1_1 [Cyberlindnera fabianii]
MIDKLPTEIISQELLKFIDEKDEYALMLTCKSTHFATKDHFSKTYKPQPSLICFDNPVHHDFHYQHLYRTWAYKKALNCSTDNYYENPGKYRTLDNHEVLVEAYKQIASKL